jgi:HPt (histidine-containing phosphotransfer) domain-containing protein
MPAKSPTIAKAWWNVSFVMAAKGSRRSGKDTQPGILDVEHLGHMTLGDCQLEREVLEIFVRQSATTLDLVLDRLARRDPAAAAAAAHAMIGSARGIGAWRVAQAAEQLERAANARNEQELDGALAALKAASLEANAAIGAHLADPANRTAECA